MTSLSMGRKTQSINHTYIHTYIHTCRLRYNHSYTNAYVHNRYRQIDITYWCHYGSLLCFRN